MDYTVIRSARRTLALEITREAKVLVRAPLRASNAWIERFVDAHRDWIEKHLAKRQAQLVLCTGDEVLHDFALNGEYQVWTFDVGSSSFYLRIAGESCGFSVTYRYVWD